jgi:hypothetical protein
LKAALNAQKSADAADRADAISQLARRLGALALSSGVAEAQVKETNKSGKKLADLADQLHTIADKGAASADDSQRMGALMKNMEATLALVRDGKAAPAVYFCPMHCEEAKTYDKPGKCPVCLMNLKKLTDDKYKVEIDPVPPAKIEAGKPVTLKFMLMDPTGLALKRVEIVHEKPLHLLMVNSDLSWYAHEHPELQPDGTFLFTWTFPAPGEYTLFNDFTPADVGMQVVPVKITVTGAAALPAAAPLKVDSGAPKSIDGYTITLDTGGPIKANAATHLVYTISCVGQPVTDLTPYLGAMGHLVIISQDLTEFVHSHPHEHGAAASVPSRKGGPKVEFEAHFAKPGLYKAWAQFEHRGKVVTVPFVIEVESTEPRR